jgi:hypothetical protein
VKELHVFFISIFSITQCPLRIAQLRPEPQRTAQVGQRREHAPVFRQSHGGNSER